MADDVQELARGTRLLERFELRQVVGEGGMGVVWAAQDLVTSRPVALKFHKSTGSADDRSRERFMREAEAAMSVRHPNVASVHAVLSTKSGVPFLVMDLLQGESLRQRLERPPQLALVEVAHIMARVCAAVEAAHALPLIHRDLKPENIFLTRDSVQVLDFGIAKRLPRSGFGDAQTALTSAGGFIGTPCYMAPEQIYGEELDERTDVWSLGIVLYECLTGVLPTGGGLGHTLKVITRDGVRPIHEVGPHVPAPLAAVVMRMLSLRPADRPSLTEVRQVLEAQFSSSRSVANSGSGANVTTAPSAARQRSPQAQGSASRPRQGTGWGMGLLLATAIGVTVGGACIVVSLSGPTATAPTSKPTTRATPKAAVITPEPKASSEHIPLRPIPPIPKDTILVTDAGTWNFSAGAGHFAGLANAAEMQEALRGYMYTLKPCLPVPGPGVNWSISGSFMWTSAGMSPATIRHNRTGPDAGPDKDVLESCVRQKMESWDLPRGELRDPGHQGAAQFWAIYVEISPKDAGGPLEFRR